MTARYNGVTWPTHREVATMTDSERGVLLVSLRDAFAEATYFQALSGSPEVIEFHGASGPWHDEINRQAEIVAGLIQLVYALGFD